MDITGEVCRSFGHSSVRPSCTEKGHFAVLRIFQNGVHRWIRLAKLCKLDYRFVSFGVRTISELQLEVFGFSGVGPTGAVLFGMLFAVVEVTGGSVIQKHEV